MLHTQLTAEETRKAIARLPRGITPKKVKGRPGKGQVFEFKDGTKGTRWSQIEIATKYRAKGSGISKYIPNGDNQIYAEVQAHNAMIQLRRMQHKGPKGNNRRENRGRQGRSTRLMLVQRIPEQVTLDGTVNGQRVKAKVKTSSFRKVYGIRPSN